LYFTTLKNLDEVFLNVSSSVMPSIFLSRFRKCFRDMVDMLFKNPCGTCTYTYEWKIFAYDYQFCTCCGCWREIVYINKYVEGMSVWNSFHKTLHKSILPVINITCMCQKGLVYKERNSKTLVIVFMFTM